MKATDEMIEAAQQEWTGVAMPFAKIAPPFVARIRGILDAAFADTSASAAKQGDENRYAGWDTDLLADQCEEVANTCTRDAALKIFALTNRVRALYHGTTRAEPAEQLTRLRERNRIYRKQLRELNAALRVARLVTDLQAETTLRLRAQLTAAKSSAPA